MDWQRVTLISFKSGLLCTRIIGTFKILIKTCDGLSLELINIFHKMEIMVGNQNNLEANLPHRKKDDGSTLEVPLYFAYLV